ncbi:MAG: delta-60 repeat domain-containing protein [Chloroflexia bacterium]
MTFGQDDSARDVLLQPDGKLVVIGFSQNEQGENFRFVLARLNPSGTLDLSFGRGGKVITDPTADRDIAMSAALQKDGKIIVLGTRGDDQCLACAGHALVRYLSDGRLDPTFGQSGKVLDSFSSGSFSFQVNARDVVVQPDGKLVVLAE